MKTYYKYIIGIDEVGRGPLAGPVAVGAVLFSKEEYGKFKKTNAEKDIFLRRSGSNGRGGTIRRVKDSKKLSEKKREEWLEKIRKNKNIRYIACFTGARQIDKIGIVKAISKALNKTLIKFDVSPDKCLVLLDGTLKAPCEFKNQKTIINGDEKELVISLASIVARVERDRKMKNFAKKYPEYNFEKHKGYGTKEHYKRIEKYGLCAIHRRSFLT